MKRILSLFIVLAVSVSIVAAADAYVRYFNIDLPVRFDIVTLLKDGKGYYIREHIEDAFYSPVH